MELCLKRCGLALLLAVSICILRDWLARQSSKSDQELTLALLAVQADMCWRLVLPLL